MPAYIALLIGALSASLVSRSNLRGIFWLVLGQVAFWLPMLYWDFVLPLPMLFCSICDTLVVYSIYNFGKEKWESWIMFIYVASILTSFSAQGMVILNENFEIHIYSWVLYVLNWAAIFVVGTASGFKKAGYGTDFFAFANWTTIFGRERAVAKKATREW